MIEDRHAKLIKNLPKHNYHVMPAAIEAGFAKNTAAKQGKRLLKNAIKRHARNTISEIESTQSNMREVKRTLADLVGMSSNEVFERLKNIALNDRDYNAALKVLTPIAKDLGVDLTTDEGNRTIVPVINVSVKEKQPIDGPIEPPIE